MNAFNPPYEVIALSQKVVEMVKFGIVGRVADEHNNTSLMVQASVLSGPGDHLEIGTLFGGSAIAVALAKKLLGDDGTVFCVDPLDGYYMGTQWQCNVDPVCGTKISAHQVLSNAAKFGVADRIVVIQKPSYPWPAELRKHQFASAYIDGNHWGDIPKVDWENTRHVTNGYITFDNYDETHPAVMEACRLASTTPGWKEVYRGGITYIVRRA